MQALGYDTERQRQSLPPAFGRRPSARAPASPRRFYCARFGPSVATRARDTCQVGDAERLGCVLGPRARSSTRQRPAPRHGHSFRGARRESALERFCVGRCHSQARAGALGHHSKRRDQARRCLEPMEGAWVTSRPGGSASARARKCIPRRLTFGAWGERGTPHLCRALALSTRSSAARICCSRWAHAPVPKRARCRWWGQSGPSTNLRSSRRRDAEADED
mmetsp:Transcript_28741/g.93889  ORF Transcript_28741/g.93889 Transcript_28741/m.93889 type:complete len:221 (-) Transcript_28741:1139-1801(-)